MRTFLLVTFLMSTAAACTEPPSTEVRPTLVDAPVLGNRVCPVSGEPVAGDPLNPTFRATHRGVVIGFMCPVHLREFEEGTPEQQDRWLESARASLRK
ncbi:MAG: hypothetical protein AB2A00_04820 [Myxococcota bacterium]